MSAITIVNRISRKVFYNEFVNKGKPILIKKQTKTWAAHTLWDAEYFKKPKWDLDIITKTGDVSQGKKETTKLSHYVDGLIAYENQLKNGGTSIKPAYLHDVPIFSLIPDLIKDVEPFPLELFPKWYWKNWHNYIQFFMGGSNSFTPLHFDTLCTHNLFFQMVGSKKFILIEPEQKDLCYIKGWRWSQIDAENLDFSKFPKSKALKAMEVVVDEGDILYMPPRMLHQVRGLSYSISFNIDWHTPKSARQGVLTKFKGAPWQNIYYNWLIFMGVSLKVPSKYIFSYYKSYLNYVS